MCVQWGEDEIGLKSEEGYDVIAENHQIIIH